MGNEGAAAENNTIRIGSFGAIGNQNRFFVAGVKGVTTGSATAVPVLIDANGQLGTTSSSRRFKDNIADMNGASSVLMNLRPVTFQYKAHGTGDDRPLQYGLIAEEVAEVAPELVAYSKDSKIETVYYQHLPPMLLNEFQKQQRTIAAQAAELRSQVAELAQQREKMVTLDGELQSIKAMLGVR